ncbi:MAG TPA: hypothetical protein VGY99_23170 [Candidatus Binataceae bacterium]|nr:hypothetical protein [Candidatus Binataceae bacterium]
MAGVLWAFCAWAQMPPSGPNPQGFASPAQNLLTPFLRLAPPGRADQALEIYDRIHELDRKLFLHPALSPSLRSMLYKLPAPEVIPIEMGSLYTNSDIPWMSAPPDIHFLAVEGQPDGATYLYALSDRSNLPHQPGHLEAEFRVTPQPHNGAPPIQSVTAKLEGLLYISSATPPARGMDTTLGFEREIYGTMAPPWDEKPGVFNHHDRAAIARLRRDLPATSERLGHYLTIHNLLDEFNGPSGPWMLFNLDAEVREAALAPFPHLDAFWREAAGRVDAQTVVRDEAGRRWLLSGFHRGRITLTFMLRGGMLTPMDAAMAPAGAPLPIEQIASGRFYAESTVSVQRFGMRFGLAGIRFATSYSNRDGAIRFDGHMTDVPRLVAPPIIHPLTMLLAGEFLETIARGNDGHGASASFSALPGPQGGTMTAGSVSAELRNAPALAMLARIAAAFAPGYGEQVREEQRRLTAEFFDAFDSDYRRSRPILLGTAAVPLGSRSQ